METLKFEFNIDQVNIILGSLAKMPYEAVAPVIEDIQKQARPQLAQQEPAQEPK